MMEKTLIIIKPDSLSKGVLGNIIAEFEKAGLKPLAAKMVFMTKEQAQGFYSEHVGKQFYGPLVEFMSSNPAIVMVWSCPDAVILARSIIGATNPANAEEGTIRKQWAQDGRHNAVHGSDSNQSAEREISFFFPENNGIFEWEKKEYHL
jgi:nucleoside-diphosphate kinase